VAREAGSQRLKPLEDVTEQYECTQPCYGGDPCIWEGEPKWVMKGKVARCGNGRFVKVRRQGIEINSE